MNTSELPDFADMIAAVDTHKWTARLDEVWTVYDRDGKVIAEGPTMRTAIAAAMEQTPK